MGATHRWFHPEPPGMCWGELRDHRQREQHRIRRRLPSRRLTGQGLAMLAEANKPYRRVTSSSFVAICFSQQRTNTSSRYSLYNRVEQGWEAAWLRTGAAPAKLARAWTLILDSVGCSLSKCCPKAQQGHGAPTGNILRALLGAQPQHWKEKQIWSSGAFQLRVDELGSNRAFRPGKEFIAFSA